MESPFQADIVELSPELLDSFFEGTPQGTPNAADVKHPGTMSSEESNIVGTGTDNIPYYNSDEDDSVDETKSEVVETTEDKTPEELEAAKKVEDDKKASEEKETEEGDKVGVNEVLKNTVDYLIKKGQWTDFDGREDLEITEEVYADLASKQNEHSAYKLVNELIDSTGDYGKAIISHIKQGGNPDEIIDLFKEQKQIESIDTSSESGKQTLIEKYYKDVLGWKTEKVEKTVKRLITDDEIDSEFTDVKELYDEHHQEQLAKVQKEVSRKEQENKDRQSVFINNIKEALDEDSTLNQKDKKLISSSILDFKHKLDNGQVVNDFYLKFAEMQKDPKKYIKMVRFILDPEGYEKQITKREESVAAAKAFSFIKNNAAVQKTATNPITQTNIPANKKVGTDFSFAIK